MRRLIPDLPRAARGPLARLVAAGVGQALAAVTVGLAVDRIFAGAVGGVPLAALGAAAAATLVLTWRERVDREALGQAVAHDVRMTLTAHLVRMPAGSGPDDVVLRFTGDLTALRNWYAGGVAALVTGLPVLAGGLVGIALVDAGLAGVLAAMLGVTLGVQALAGPRLRAAGEEAVRRRARLARDVAERAAALPTVQLFGRSGPETRRIEARSLALGTAMAERARWSGWLRASADWTAAGLPLAIALVWLARGSVDVGAGAAVLVIGGLVGPRIQALGRIREYRELARVSQDRIAEFLARDTLDAREGARDTAARGGALALRGLTLPGVFGPLSAEAKAGARIALTGPNGVGKSRLLGVIAGLEQPGAGTVVLDRQNASGRTLASLRKAVALAGPGLPLMRGTVGENIRYGARLSGAEAEAALALGGAEAFLDSLPKGAATRVGTGGRGLSLGQQARVALLRALMRGPALLLLDEIEANLDVEGLAVLDGVLDRFPGTIVMATHSREWIARCGVEWSMEAGTLTVRPERKERKRHG